MHNPSPIHVLHLIPHAGGGVGTVVRALLSGSLKQGGFVHRIASLEGLNEATKTWCQEQGVTYLECGWQMRTELLMALSTHDIVHIHWWNHPLLQALMAMEDLPEMRTVLWSHVNGMHAPQVFYPALLDFPDLFVLATPYSREASLIHDEKKKSADKVRIVQSSAGVPQTASEKLHKPEQFRVGYVGTVDYGKMHRDFIEIWKEAAVSDLPLIVCGGPSEELFRREVVEKGLAGLFDVRGVVDNVHDILADLHVFMYPLARTHYGTGEQALLEAMSFGAVPVVFDNGCERYLVKNVETGIVASDKEEFITGLRFLKENTDARKQMAKRGKTYVRREFGIEKIVLQWHGLYHELVNQPKRSHCLHLSAVDGVKDKSTSLLFLNSYGESPEGKKMRSWITDAENLTAEDMFALPPACFAKTRGSPFHYRACLPGDPLLERFCLRLEEILHNQT